jgi:hypothetical protein
MAFKRLQGRLDQLQAHANSTMSGADTLIALAKDLLLDIKDGVGIKVRPLKGFSRFANRLVVCVVGYLIRVLVTQLRGHLPFGPSMTSELIELDLTWMEGEEIPLSVSFDPEVDIQPHRISKFVGGPFDGKEYVVDQSKAELLLEGGSRYVWDGKAFTYQPVA